MHTRRFFVQILPLAGLSALAACGDKTASSSAAPGPAAAPAPAPAPAPTPAAQPTPPVTAATPATAPAAASAGPLVDPADATAKALGYVSDAKTTTDPKHTAGAACANCALYGGKQGDPSGPCPLFAGKQVLATAWCVSYAKKA